MRAVSEITHKNRRICQRYSFIHLFSPSLTCRSGCRSQLCTRWQLCTTISTHVSWVTDSKEIDSTQGVDFYQREEGRKSRGSSGPTGSKQRPTAADRPVFALQAGRSVCYLGIHLGLFFFLLVLLFSTHWPLRISVQFSPSEQSSSK